MTMKLAIMVKEKSGDSFKVRFIVDMLRSGITRWSREVRESYSPGGTFLITAVVNLWETTGFDGEAEFRVADIRTLPSCQTKRKSRFTIITDSESYYDI